MITFSEFSGKTAGRLAFFGLLGILTILLYRAELRKLIVLSLNDDRFSYIIPVPFISIFLICLRRNTVFRTSYYCRGVVLPLFVAGAALWYGSRASYGNENFSLSIAVLAVMIMWIGAFALCFGAKAVQAAIFPLTFLLLMVPLPPSVMGKIAVALQKSSADTAFALFKLAGVPVFRDGFRFSLPSIDIEIAEQCSGIRSTLSLLITALLAGHVFLQLAWRKVCFVLLTVPIVIFKNAVRIFTISWLGIHVNRGFFYGSLHHYGGLPFSLVSLALMGLVLFLLTGSAFPKPWSR